MSFNLAMKKRYYVCFIFISLVGFATLYMGLFSIVLHYNGGILIIVLAPIILFFSGRFLFFHNINIHQEYLLLNFGAFYINKKIYYKDISKFRYAIKGDQILMGQPGVDGILSDTIALTFNDGKMLFIPVENAHAFCEILKERDCIEEIILGDINH